MISSFAVRMTVLAVALASLLAVFGTSAASARGTTSSRVESVCAKRAEHASASRYKAQWRRCVVHLRSSTRTTDSTAPTVSWQAPSNGVTVNGNLEGTSCLANASDNRAVTKVVFKVDGTTLNTELYAPWNCHFDSTKVANGTHTLTATAYDAAGNSRSASISVGVSNGTVPAPTPAPEPTPTPVGDTTAPTVAWQVPTAGSMIKGTLQGSSCEVSASDDHGVTSVVFKVDGTTTLNTESDAPWNCSFDTTKVSDGSHTVIATAYDAAGNSSSASRSFTVSNAVAPAPTPVPTPEPTPTPSPTGMIVGLDAGNYGSSGAADVHGAVNTVRYDTERGVSALENFKKAGLRIQMVFPGNYNNDGVCALNPSAWASETLSFYKANTNPTQTPVIEALNEPGGTWFWGPNAESSANATCYRELLKKTHDAFHAQYGEAAPKILGTLDGGNGLSFGKAWYTSDWRTYVDGFIVHPYGGTGSRSSSALGNRAIVESARAMTGGPIYITEVGWPTATGQSSTGDSLQWNESEQATNITNFIAWASGTGYVAEVVYFNYHDYGTNDWYGIVRNDGSHKPAYEALRQAAVKYGA
jgi:Bacterial Ig domain